MSGLSLGVLRQTIDRLRCRVELELFDRLIDARGLRSESGPKNSSLIYGEWEPSFKL